MNFEAMGGPFQAYSLHVPYVVIPQSVVRILDFRKKIKNKKIKK